jgi:purine nucleosidase
MTSPARTTLLIDCDTGIDDALALLYACASPEADIVAVTCVAGNVGLDDVLRNTLAVLELAGRGDVMVAAGRDRPLARPLRTAPETHGPRGLGYAELPAPRVAACGVAAADLIVAAARTRPSALTMVTLGPLSNLAVAVLREPELPVLLAGLVMMVGSYRSPGNTAPTSEWNAALDPEALAIVLRAWEQAGAPRPRAFGLDVTERAKLTPEHLALLAARGGGTDGPVVRFVTDALRFYFEFHARYDGFTGAFIHDALAVAAALDPGLARVESVPVEVELGGRLTTGETVTDWRRAWGRPPNLDVAVDADVTTFFERFVERVGGLAAALAALPAGPAGTEELGPGPGRGPGRQ